MIQYLIAEKGLMQKCGNPSTSRSWMKSSDMREAEE
jgi:hypothetical protein